MPILIKPLPPFSAADIARFLSKIDKTPGHGPQSVCWKWTDFKYPDGYGRFTVPAGSGRSRFIPAHRIAYFLHYGEDPYPFLVCHTCDFGLCCFGPHLFKGSHLDNMADCKAKGRQTRTVGETHGLAKLTNEAVLAIRAIHATSGLSSYALAPLFGVAPRTIRHVVQRTRWKHIE